MKKLLLPLCAMLLCMTACQKEENNGILTLEVEHYNSDTKLHLDANFAVWDNNDEVLLNEVRKPVTINGNTATISGVEAAADYKAVYPFGWTSTLSNIPLITYPEYQFNYNGRIIAPMAAKYEDGKLKFKNLGAILAVNVNTSMTVDRIEVIAEGNVLISGTFPISYTSERPTLGDTTFTDDGTNMTTLICNETVTSAGKTFYIALPPIEAQLTIKVYSGNTCYSKTQNNSLALQANHGYSINLNDGFNTTTPMPDNNQFFYTSTTGMIDFTPIGAVDNIYDESIGQYIVTFTDEIESIPGNNNNSYFKYCTSITLPASVTTLGVKAFYRCTSLSSIIMPGVTSIGSNAFTQCSSLRTISMPKVETIDMQAFYSCTDLETVAMPKVDSIGSNAFRSCGNLSNVYCTLSASIINTNSFPSVPRGAKLHLPLSGYNNLTWTGWLPEQHYYDL